jgi:hypothetical protein
MAFKRAKTAPTPMPNKTKGKEISQTKGQATRASNAKGQLTPNRMNQTTKNKSVFMASI